MAGASKRNAMLYISAHRLLGSCFCRRGWCVSDARR